MPSKKEDEFEEDEEFSKPEEKNGFRIGLSTIIAGVIFIVLSEAFFYRLSTKTDATFEMKEIIFGFIVAVTITLFLLWIKFLMNSNRYLGAVIGIAGTGATIYALKTQFRGPNTTTFVIISLIVALTYIFLHFWKSSEK